MTNQEYVIKLQLREDELIKICNYHNIYDCKDIIQDLYFKLLTKDNVQLIKYSTDSQPNMFIIFMILKNLISDYRKKESRFIKEELYDNYITDEIEQNDKYEFVIHILENMDEKRKPDWFDKKILQLYIYNEHTIRSLSKETKIPTGVIQKIVHTFKLKCAEEYEKSKLQKSSF